MTAIEGNIIIDDAVSVGNLAAFSVCDEAFENDAERESLRLPGIDHHRGEQ